MARDDDYDSPAEEELKIDYGYDRVIIVDNLPVIDSSKYEKLKAMLVKIYTQISPKAEVSMPTDGNGGNKGYCFVEFPDAATAVQAVEITNGHKLDKSHIFKVSLLPEFDRVMKVPDEFVQPEIKPFQELQDLNYWLQDERAREMFVIRHGEDSDVFLHEASQNPVKVYGRKNWSEFGHQFSPKGSYLITFHKPGVGIWGGPNWERFNRFPHHQVKYVDFSPCENYLVTMSEIIELGPKGQPIQSDTVQQHLIIWNVAAAKPVREFTGVVPKNTPWPQFKWSHDDKFLARLVDEVIYVYESPEFVLLDKKSFKYPGSKDFSWSPTQNVFAVYTPEQGDAPAKVTIVEVPSRRELRNKNLYKVSDVKMHWQQAGEYLCVKVDHHSKSKKTVTTKFELFRIKEKDIPVEVLEMKDQVIAFAWEPKGHRFCVCHGEPPRVDVSFYTMRPSVSQPAGKKPKGAAKLLAGTSEIVTVTHLRTLEKVAANHIFWSPTGSFVVLAGLKNLNGKLTFYNANDFELMAEEEHFMCTDIEWDPSGRYVTSYVSHWRQSMENGYIIWSFAGKQMVKSSLDKFYQFLWRPRPAPLLSSNKIKEITKNLSAYTKRYLEEDAKLKSAQDSERAAGKRKIKIVFEEGERVRTTKYNQQREARRALRGGYPSDDEGDYEWVEKTFDEVLNVSEEPVRE